MPDDQHAKSRSIAFQTPWFTIQSVPATADGRGEYYTYDSGDGVVALPMTPDGAFLMVEQYRPPLGALTLEFPAGELDPGETEVTAAARETLEETGHVCEHWQLLSPARTLLNRSSHREFFVLGINARPVSDWTPEEDVRPRILSRRYLAERIRGDMFEHTMALAAFTIAREKLGIDLLHDDPQTIAAAIRANAG